MKIKIRRRSASAYFHCAVFMAILFACFHFNNVTIASIKISELAMLVMAPVLLLYIKSVNKYILLLGGFFLLLILATVVANLSQEFYIDRLSLSIVKQPYFISFVRFIEYVCCLAFGVYCYKSLQYFERQNFDINRLILFFLWINGAFSILFLVLYVLHSTGTINAWPTGFFYYGMRLKGFYDEGGPFGLMYATLFCLSTLIARRNLLLKLLFCLTVIAAESKAGILMIILWMAYHWYELLPKRGLLRPAAIVVGSALVILVGSFIIENYIIIISNVQREVLLRPHDNNLVMGRVSGFFITPKMIAQNPLLGVGMGNYSLVRNTPDYLGFFPPVEEWDLSGLGGLITLTAESGIVGLLGFVTLIIALCRRLSKRVPTIFRNKLVLLFVLPFLLGVQLYFVYVWFSIGYILYLSSRHTPLPSANA